MPPGCQGRRVARSRARVPRSLCRRRLGAGPRPARGSTAGSAPGRRPPCAGSPAGHADHSGGDRDVRLAEHLPRGERSRTRLGDPPAEHDSLDHDEGVGVRRGAAPLRRPGSARHRRHQRVASADALAAAGSPRGSERSSSRTSSMQKALPVRRRRHTRLTRRPVRQGSWRFDLPCGHSAEQRAEGAAAPERIESLCSSPGARISASAWRECAAKHSSPMGERMVRAQ